MKKIIDFIPFLMFALYTAYHAWLTVQYLSLQMNTNSFGRVIGLLDFLMLTAASFFLLLPVPALWVCRRILLIIALAVNFFFKLGNTGYFLNRLTLSNPSSVLSFAVFVLSETAVLLLLVYYLFFHRNSQIVNSRRVAVRMMTVVIALYVVCLVLEGVLLLHFRVGIDRDLLTTVLSRCAYYGGFIGTAVSFMCRAEKPMQFDSSKDGGSVKTDKEFVFSNSSASGAPVPKGKNPALGELNQDFVL